MAKRVKNQEHIDRTVSVLEIIYDKVMVSKNHDRYIVGNTDGEWGVVDSNGNIIIPVKYTRITTSNDKVFRVYGESVGTKATMFGKFNVKVQSVFTYDGKQLIDFKPYAKALSIGKYGILLGDELCTGSNDSYYIGYNGEVFHITDKLKGAYITKYVPELIVIVDESALNYNMGHRPDIGIRADRDKIELKSLKDCYDELHELDVETMTANGVNYSGNEYIKGLAKQYKKSKVYIGIINGKAILVDSDHLPVFRKTDKKYAWKSIND